MPEEKDDSTKAFPPRFFRVREDILREIAEGLERIANPNVRYHENNIKFLKNVIAQGRSEAEKLKELITEDDLHFVFGKEMPSDEQDA